jgi:predicted  nucleic acid-binding Zn-ribbon protein
MIDTDKYEGHTEGPWAWERGALNVLHVKDSEPMHTLLHDEKKDADAQLIADAPLLLAEVIRLRELNDDLDCDLQGFQEAAKEDEAALKDLVDSLEGIEEELKAEVKRLREAIADIATNMEAADASYMGGFIEDLRKVIE